MIGVVPLHLGEVVRQQKCHCRESSGAPARQLDGQTSRHVRVWLLIIALKRSIAA